MADKGFTVTPDVDSPGHEAITGSYTDAQAGAFDVATRSCEASTGMGAAPPPLTAEQAGHEYDDLTRVAECLEGLGFTIPPAPSWQSFVDAAVGGSTTLWYPYTAVLKTGGTTYADYQKALKQCPQHYTTADLAQGADS